MVIKTIVERWVWTIFWKGLVPCDHLITYTVSAQSVFFYVVAVDDVGDNVVVVVDPETYL